MRCFVTSLLTICIIVLACGASTLQAAWVENGAVVCAAGQIQDYPEIASDGAGGAVITWRDYRTGDANIYAQRVDEHGNALWTIDGVAVCTATGHQYYPQIVSDGAGGAIITWHDGRSGWDIYAQRVDASGTVLWAADGVPVCTYANDQYYPEIAPDGEGGAIIAWIDMRSGSSFDIYAQRINASGVAQWTANGIIICTAAQEQMDIAMIPDGAGGAVICWQDRRSGTNDIYANRINGSGMSLWVSNGLAVCTAANGQENPVLVGDGTGGAIFSWWDYRGSDTDIYAQCVTGAGTVKWAANGVVVCSVTQIQYYPQMASDLCGGAIISWYDYRSGISGDQFIQRLDADGNRLWGPDGKAVCTQSGEQHYGYIASDGAGGAIVTWEDERTDGGDIYAQRFDAMGGTLWAADGVAVSAETGQQRLPKLTADGSGRVIITWHDERINGNTDVYAQRLDGGASWGFPEPAIEFVRDVPGDQGGRITVAWDASQYDPLGDITEYTIWRAIAAPSAMAMIESGGALLLDGFELPAEIDRGAIRRELRGASIFYWEMIDSHAAYHIESYAKAVQTLFDSTASSDEYHYFQIIAHTSSPLVFWISEPDSGYSVDNLAPCPPLCLAGEQSYVPEGLTLTWAPNEESDLDCYQIYRGTGPGFTPGAGNLIASHCDTILFDGDWRWNAGYCYKVAAVDVHGNESGYALLCSDNITGGDTPPAAPVTYLGQNYPNPFNPATRIAFGLSEPAHVRLRIYDASGRLVRTLVDGHREAGVYEESWDGIDGNAAGAASGVYFYELEAQGLRITKKMVLLR